MIGINVVKTPMRQYIMAAGGGREIRLSSAFDGDTPVAYVVESLLGGFLNNWGGLADLYDHSPAGFADAVTEFRRRVRDVL